MTFWQKYEFEEDKDGVQVEYKFSGDTSWNVLETSEGYTGQSQGYGGFNQGDPIYTGDNNIWHEQHFHLSQGDILPESLFISWRFGSNNRGAMEGYYLDDIAVLFHAPIPDEEDNLLGKNSDVLSQTPIEIFGVYPNPVCNRCNIRFLVTNQQSVNLSIFDVTGRSIRTVVDAELMPGTYIAEWDCRDSENYLIPSGTYYYILKNGNNLECDKIIVIR
ncbi:MAG: hypothetical protein APR63_09425 [Desulfuromonas sp. SDB]|nr:MAG: hypothetical protein APR63_09425 [Desulfuromonas sp. SDB]